ncbi:MAG: hypothetical protein GX421_04350 [Caldisericales bacterium]|nr:hypothetical protein [Caldisericales bacterium]
MENKNTVPLKNSIDAANKDINFVFQDTFALGVFAGSVIVLSLPSFCI